LLLVVTILLERSLSKGHRMVLTDLMG